ncbi:Acetoacetate metabolism regulatory protein AtoC [Candidatus Sulfotelmatobacter kueseliae]|uniref:Acetoacetate metabolism regulatory protein AtoC n=1 Tax=Candidatus Sulfotelmatobacter kueseliae TaxID=2042962 RepID=A0A2U3KIC3_9BACT|nr:Acetoacetate metabolism regulatory protein AtoC [Candidatus Sulfotelmatobacter kueseliae]
MSASGPLGTLPGNKLAAYRGDCVQAAEANYCRPSAAAARQQESLSPPMNQEKVLIVEDEENERTGLAELVSSWGYRVETARDGADGLQKATHWSPSIVITDLKMPRMGGIELLGHLGQLAENAQTIAVILVTAQGTIDSAVQAMRMGAYDYITKPIDTNRLRTILANASALLGTRAELEATRRRLRDAGSLGRLTGSSRKMQEIFRLIEMVAPSTASVLITGASGTGKELVARTIHELSPRKDRTFVAINCAAIPETLMESEIFGHEKGAFTGALERRTGCFELAEGGTLLLDEIGEMPVGTQAKLLRVLEDRKVRRLGSKVETAVDVRVLASTNKVPDEAVARGELRSDLYYRLNVFNIHMPPLREHKEDIPGLVELLLAEMSNKHSRRVGAVSEAVLNQFNSYCWPGNVRELRNTIERAIIVCEAGVIETKHLPPGFGQAPLRTAASDPDAVRLGVGTTVEEAEKMLILKTLEATSNNKTRAAEILGISLKTLHNKLKEYGSVAADTTPVKEDA